MKLLQTLGIVVVLCAGAALAATQGSGASSSSSSAKPSAAAPTVAEVKAPAAPVSPERLKACNTQADARRLDGDARRTFVATCLKAAP